MSQNGSDNSAPTSIGKRSRQIGRHDLQSDLLEVRQPLYGNSACRIGRFPLVVLNCFPSVTTDITVARDQSMNRFRSYSSRRSGNISSTTSRLPIATTDIPFNGLSTSVHSIWPTGIDGAKINNGGTQTSSDRIGMKIGMTSLDRVKNEIMDHVDLFPF